MKQVGLSLVLALVAVLAPVAGRSELDEVQLRLTHHLDMPLRWDNVESVPEWVDGVSPRYQWSLGYHTIKLVPGSHVTVRVPAHEQVRLVNPGGPFTPGALVVEASLGSGLYGALAAAGSIDQRSLLTPAIFNSPVLIRVSCPAETREPLDIGVFVSRRVPFATIAPYRDVLPLPTESVRMQRGDAMGQQQFWVLEPHQPATVTIQGPMRLAFEHRPVYASGETSLRQTYRVELMLDGESWRSLEFDTPAERVYPMEVDGEMRTIGRRRVSYLELPPGEHQLKMDANACLYGRLLLQAEPDYLFAKLNAPAPTAADVRQEPLPFPLAAAAPLVASSREKVPAIKLSPWSSTNTEIKRAAALHDLNPAEKETLALRLARDNSRREGGLQAAILLRAAAAATREYPEVQRVADEFIGNYSFYRNVLPADKQNPAPQRFAFFASRRIHNYGEQPRGETAALAHREEWVNRLDQGFFFDIPLKANEFPRVIQSTPQELRLLLPTDVLFAVDRSEIHPEYQSSLRAWLQPFLDKDISRIQVVGHTDYHASLRYNEALSLRRAQAVASLLLRQGVAARRLVVEGRGEVEPCADNSTTEGRQRNRRVEVVVSYREPTTVPVEAPLAGQMYRLPERSEPTILRLIADMERSTLGARFYVQFNDEKPIAFQIAHYDELSPEEYAPDDGIIGLALLARQHAIADAGTLGGPFASGARVPARLIRAATFELPIARDVRRVHIWREGREPLHLAVQYRAAKPFFLNETAMLAELQRLPQARVDTLALLHATLTLSASPDASRPVRELSNYWQGLAHYLLAQNHLLKQNVIPMMPLSELSERDDAATRQAIKSARTAEREGQWLLAVEHWSTAYRFGDADSRYGAIMARVEALLQSGETYLAEQQLKALLLSDAPMAIRQAGIDRLEKIYRSTDDREAEATLWAGLFAERGSGAHLIRLIDTLLAQDEFDLALAAWLALPESTRPLEQGLRLTYRLRWWQNFDLLLARVADPREQALWHGWRMLASGDYVAAHSYWRKAGAAGEALAQSLNDGLLLLPELRAADAHTRAAAVSR